MILSSLFSRLLTLITICFVAAILWATYLQHTSFTTSIKIQTKNAFNVIENEITYEIESISRIMKALMNDSDAFTMNVFQIPAESSSSETQEKFAQQLRLYLPQYYAFALINSDKELWPEDPMQEYISLECLKDIDNYMRNIKQTTTYKTYVHPQPFNYHFDIMTPWINKNEQLGLFFVSFKLSRLAHIFNTNTSLSTNFYLTRNDIPNLIEVGPQGTRDTMTREILLSQAEKSNIVLRSEIKNTRWILVAVANTSYKSQIVSTIWLRTTTAILIITLLWFLTIKKIHKNITQRKRAYQQIKILNQQLENRVATSSSELHAIIKGSPSGIITANIKGIIESFSPASERIFGWKEQEIIGKNLTILMTGEDKEQHKGYLDRLFKSRIPTPSTQRGREVCGITKDGKQISLIIAVSMVDLPDKVIFVGMINDISEHKSIQKQLIQSKKLASLGQMVAGIAHEINSPLGTAVTNISELTQRTRFFEHKITQGISKVEMDNYLTDVSDFTNMANDNLLKAAELVRSFKLVAVDRSSEEMRTFNLKTLLSATLTTIKHEFKHSDIAINLHVPQGLTMNNYPGAISQVFSNLIHNSRIHGFDNGNNSGIINITADQDVKSGIVSISYQDNGTGLSREQREKIFDPFFTTKRNQGGSGLGMHVVHNLVNDLLGGHITLDSNLGRGVKFEIHIPSNIDISFDHSI